jgi:hypothetical protein
MVTYNLWLYVTIFPFSFHAQIVLHAICFITHLLRHIFPCDTGTHDDFSAEPSQQAKESFKAIWSQSNSKNKITLTP